MPMLTIAAMITPTILKYICKSLKLRLLTRPSQELLDKLNIMYIVGKITKPKYENLAFLILDSGGVGVIPKIMVFVNDIEDI